MTTFVEPDSIKDYVEIGRALSVEPRMFGETMIAQARKAPEEPLFRYPDCIYDSERYYKSTHPLLRPGLDAALDAFLKRSNPNDAHSQEMNERASAAIEAEQKANERASAAVEAEKEALFLCDIDRTKLDTAELDLRAAEERAQQAEERALDAMFQHDLIVRSASWRATGPLRSALDRLRSVAQRHKPSAVISTELVDADVAETNQSQ